MNANIQQARRILCSSLLLFLLAACGGEPAPTPQPTLSLELTPSPLPGTPTSEPTATPMPRLEVETYTVQPGDTLRSIAAAYSLQPETILWANYDALLDIPDLLFEEMQLTILPVDGVYHQVGGGDSVNNIAAFFSADPQAIITWAGNGIDPANAVIQPGQWLVIPGGQRSLGRRTMPNLPRTAMAVDFLEFGAGACPLNVQGGAVGDGVYAPPVAAVDVTGEDFWSAHPGVDLAAEPGQPILAADDGVVTFSGWSNFGYGFAVMLDHGNGQFSLYAGLAEVQALCGASLLQGEALGTAGHIGHPAGTFVHFEIRQGGAPVDPMLLLP
ncbi:MAG: peptidoglycan DD-metalloendopeptidase family protein [Anaerolineales bacterium]|nr:MAG: peptidoglycan DD-metalloendopeptidase family protein [Anaerolineales bacterium]